MRFLIPCSLLDLGVSQKPTSLTHSLGPVTCVTSSAMLLIAMSAWLVVGKQKINKIKQTLRCCYGNRVFNSESLLTVRSKFKFNRPTTKRLWAIQVTTKVEMNIFRIHFSFPWSFEPDWRILGQDNFSLGKKRKTLLSQHLSFLYFAPSSYPFSLKAVSRKFSKVIH